VQNLDALHRKNSSRKAADFGEFQAIRQNCYDVSQLFCPEKITIIVKEDLS
jgi:hypothetical protein